MGLNEGIGAVPYNQGRKEEGVEVRNCYRDTKSSGYKIGME